MKASVISAVALLGSVTLAQPHHVNKRHAHGAKHDKRALVWVTETAIVTETIDITSTVWIDADATQPPATTTSASDARFYTASEAVHTTEPAKPSTTLSSVYVAPPAPSSTSVYVEPYVAPSVAPPAPTTTSVYVPPVVQTPEPVPQPTTTVTPVAAVAAPTTKAAAVVTPSAESASPSSGSSSSYSGTCSSGSKCDGEITFYDTGLGACGWDNDGLTERVVALPAGLMGAQSNGNPFCGMTITVSLGGKTTTAKVVDKCPGCSNNAIDLSRKAFADLADEGIGRTEAKWWFN